MQNMIDGTMSSCSTVMVLVPTNTTHESLDDYNHDYSHSSSSTSRVNHSQKEYFEKIQGYYHYTFIPSMSELAALNPIEDTVEGMANK